MNKQQKAERIAELIKMFSAKLKELIDSGADDYGKKLALEISDECADDRHMLDYLHDEIAYWHLEDLVQTAYEQLFDKLGAKKRVISNRAAYSDVCSECGSENVECECPFCAEQFCFACWENHEKETWQAGRVTCQTTS